jgi:hypothetical protein
MNPFKKITSWFIFLILLNSSIFSQDSTLSTQDSLHIGIQIGGNLSSIHGVNVRSESPTKKTGFNIGYYLSYPLNNFSDLNFELWYIKKGSGWGCNNLYCDDEYRLSYLELPVYYSLKILKHKNSNKLLNLQAGLFFSYNVARNAKSVSYITGEREYSLEDIIKKYDYGITFSLQWFIIKEQGFIRINYDLGLAPMFKTLENLTVEDIDRSKQRMRSLIFFIGYEGL